MFAVPSAGRPARHRYRATCYNPADIFFTVIYVPERRNSSMRSALSSDIGLCSAKMKFRLETTSVFAAAQRAVIVYRAFIRRTVKIGAIAVRVTRDVIWSVRIILYLAL